MKHTFDIRLAEKYGMAEAVLAENLFFWVKKNAANESNYHDGKYWTYNSRKAFSRLFPYLKEKSIERALNHLVDEGLLLKGNFNEDKFDKTMWYAFTQKGESEMAETVDFSDVDKLSVSIGQIDQSTGQNDPPIPYINNTDNTLIKENHTPNGVCQKKVVNKFTPPTPDEVRAYCSEKGYTVDPDRFVDYYTSNGWMVGKNHMKDWKAAVRTWVRSQKPTADDIRKQKEAEDMKRYEQWEREANERKRVHETEEYY